MCSNPGGIIPPLLPLLSVQGGSHCKPLRTSPQESLTTWFYPKAFSIRQDPAPNAQ